MNLDKFDDFISKHADTLHNSFIFTIWGFMVIGIVFIIKEILK